jgi:hypothetical protein
MGDFCFRFFWGVSFLGGSTFAGSSAKIDIGRRKKVRRRASDDRMINWLGGGFNGFCAKLRSQVINHSLDAGGFRHFFWN